MSSTPSPSYEPEDIIESSDDDVMIVEPEDEVIMIESSDEEVELVGATSTRIKQTTVRPVKTSAPMKDECFEETVRAATAVTSNLSFQLTQLDGQMSQATNVGALVTVQSKFQEALTTSINALTQLRTNLRLESIQGIKNMKVTPKPIPSPKVSGTITVSDDDDVILVTSPK